eukprot:TRINITY_DN663_c4_g1_i1.p1 TRINITY_DN663_c4_g1~~TRINITY_DN663_c4_g1_i1.p1  ORF type:complete len:859 (+),score=160.63 TRINITY_DN663_c4_g1_i1:101-2578(+)
MADSKDEKELQPPAPPVEPSLKIYINKSTTYLGKTLLKEFSVESTPAGPKHTFFTSDQSLPGGVSSNIAEAWKVLAITCTKIQEEPTSGFCEKLKDCDLMVFDLATCNHQALEFALKSFKMQDTWDSKKVIILLSSIMTWAQTAVQYKKNAEAEEEAEEQPEGEQKEEQEPEEESEEEEKEEGEAEEDNKEGEAEQEEPVPKKKVLAFKESQYYMRVPDPAYTSYKFLETLALSIGVSKGKEKPEEKKLSVYVLCAGLLYGNGEDVFYEYFKQAWLQNPEKLPIIGKGGNLVPTIHVVDLARLVKRVVRLTPKNSYIVAIDRSKRPTQRKIITAISKAIGTGLVESRTSKELIKNSWMLPLQINVKIRPSDVFKDEPTPESEADLEAEEAEKRAKARKFPWHCEFGIVESIGKLNVEFNDYRDLKPVKIFVTAPPASGKSWLSKQLAKYYNIPHITWTELQKEGKALKGDLGEEIQKRLEEDKEKKIEEYEQLPKKQKKAIDITKYEPMIPDELLYKVLQIKLNSNVCRNRGYVLDDYPKDYKFAQYAFLKPNKKEGDEEPPAEDEAPSFEDYLLANEIAPSSVILLNASDKYVIERVKNMTEQEQGSGGDNGKYNETEIKKRLKEYRAANNPEDGTLSLADFFKERSVDALTLDLEAHAKEILLQKSKVFVERNGKPKNYMTEDEEKEKARLEELKKVEEKKKANEEQRKVKGERTEAEFKQQKKAIDERRTQKYLEHERQALEAKAKPIKEAILENIGEILSAGIAEVCEKGPEDPVEHLVTYVANNKNQAKYLFRRSLEVEGKVITIKKQLLTLIPFMKIQQ